MTLTQYDKSNSELQVGNLLAVSQSISMLYSKQAIFNSFFVVQTCIEHLSVLHHLALDSYNIVRD